jgi:hypothetical protein
MVHVLGPLRHSPSGPKAVSTGLANDHIYVNQVTFPQQTFGDAESESTKESYAFIWPFPTVVVGADPISQYPTTNGYEVVVNPEREDNDNPLPIWVQSASHSHVRILKYNVTIEEFSLVNAPADPITAALPDPAPPPGTIGVIVALGMSLLGAVPPGETVDLNPLTFDLIFLRQKEPTLHSTVAAII